MNIDDYVKQQKSIQDNLLMYIDNDVDHNDDYINIITFIDKQNILENPDDIREILYLISKISKNHHRTINFFEKIENILLYIKESIKKFIPSLDIFKIFKNNKRILLFLHTNGIITFDEIIIQYILDKSQKEDSRYHLYFLPEINKYGDEKAKKIYEEDVKKVDLNSYEFNRKSGENESELCSLIREDKSQEFVTYITKNNITISNETVHDSIFETNRFLIKNKEPTLIEYASFFGSLEIIKYLQFNGVKLESSLWLYAIHSNNADLIHFLEENKISPINYKDCFFESIKCHHNQIANYIQENFLNDQSSEQIFLISKFNDNIYERCFRSHNYFFFPENFNHEFIPFYLCQSNYFTIVEFLINEEKIDINKKMQKILRKKFYNDIPNF